MYDINRLIFFSVIVAQGVEMVPKTKIFVGRLPESCSDSELRKLFEQHGEVTECALMGNFAFIHMKTEEEADEAIKSLNNFNYDGSSLNVEVS